MKKDYQIIIGLAVSGLLLLFLGRFFSFLIIIAVILLLTAYLLGAKPWTMYGRLFEFLTKGVPFKGFGRGKFKNAKLRKEGALKVIPQDGFWFCPSCKEKNKELQDVCSNCGQEVDK